MDGVIKALERSSACRLGQLEDLLRTLAFEASRRMGDKLGGAALVSIAQEVNRAAAGLTDVLHETQELLDAAKLNLEACEKHVDRLQEELTEQMGACQVASLRAHRLQQMVDIALDKGDPKYHVRLDSPAGDKKIKAIKLLRVLAPQPIDLKDAKHLIEEAPGVLLLQNVCSDRAYKLASELSQLGLDATWGTKEDLDLYPPASNTCSPY